MKTIFPAAALWALTALAPTMGSAEGTAPGWSGSYLGFGVAQGRLDTWQFSPAQLTAPAYHKASYGGGHRYGFVQAGLRRQFGDTVVGLRLRHEKTGSDPDQFLRVDEVVSANATSVTTLSASIGQLVTPKTLAYATLGASYGRFSYGSIDERWNMVHDNLKASRKGISLGLGAEHRLTDRLSVFAEYTHTRFSKGTSTFDYGPAVYPANWTYDYKHKLGSLQLGMNLTF